MPGADPWTPSSRGARVGVARQEHLREHNLSVALAHVLDAPTPPSRAELAAVTGLARPSVTSLVDQLIRGGMVRELLPRPARRAGRPAVPLAPAPGTFAGIGMEVNVDYLGLRAVDLAGTVLAERVEAGDQRTRSPEQTLGRLAELAAGVLDRLSGQGVRVVGTSLALPGLVDAGTGPLRVAPNLGWRDVDVVGRLVRHPALLDLPPDLANEAKLAALAEARVRRGTPAPSFVYVSGEVGIGGAVVLGGELFRGQHGWSGEIGHVVVDPCVPGGPRLGTLEARAGQEAMVRIAGLPDGAPVHRLVAACASGDERALAAVAGAGRALGIALSGVVHVVDVDQVVLGGTFGQLFSYVRDEVARALDELVITAPWSPVTVGAARAGEFPAMTGGALAALRRLVQRPSAWLDRTGEPDRAQPDATPAPAPGLAATAAGGHP